MPSAFCVDAHSPMRFWTPPLVGVTGVQSCRREHISFLQSCCREHTSISTTTYLQTRVCMLYAPPELTTSSGCTCANTVARERYPRDTIVPRGVQRAEERDRPTLRLSTSPLCTLCEIRHSARRCRGQAASRVQAASSRRGPRGVLRPFVLALVLALVFVLHAHACACACACACCHM